MPQFSFDTFASELSACVAAPTVKSCRSRGGMLTPVIAMSLIESPLVAFLATCDAARARAFYESTLGLRVTADTPFALVLDSRGTTIRMQKVETFTPQPFTAMGWAVADIEKTIDQLRGRGVAFERYASLPQDEAGIWTTPDGSRVAWFKDPDGNTLSLTQAAPVSAR
jgi:catechol 2,3-dioxygenase-like lactoylglutathione lyase family enzyme